MQLLAEIVDWRGSYGFAVLEDGRRAFVHRDSLDRAHKVRPCVGTGIERASVETGPRGLVISGGTSISAADMARRRWYISQAQREREAFAAAAPLRAAAVAQFPEVLREAHEARYANAGPGAFSSGMERATPDDLIAPIAERAYQALHAAETAALRQAAEDATAAHVAHLTAESANGKPHYCQCGSRFHTGDLPAEGTQIACPGCGEVWTVHVSTTVRTVTVRNAAPADGDVGSFIGGGEWDSQERVTTRRTYWLNTNGGSAEQYDLAGRELSRRRAEAGIALTKALNPAWGWRGQERWETIRTMFPEWDLPTWGEIMPLWREATREA